MTKEQCYFGGKCKLLGTMNTREGPKFCCKYFYPPEDLENVICEQEQRGYGILVMPRIKKMK